MDKVSIQDIAKVVSSKYNLSQSEAESFVSSFFDVVNDGIKDDKSVKVKGLGTFKVIDVRERESVNVNTGERVVIEGHGKITFTPDPIMRDLVNKPFAQFETVVLNDGVDLDELDKVQNLDIEDGGIGEPDDNMPGEEVDVLDDNSVVSGESEVENDAWSDTGTADENGNGNLSDDEPVNGTLDDGDTISGAGIEYGDLPDVPEEESADEVDVNPASPVQEQQSTECDENVVGETEEVMEPEADFSHDAVDMKPEGEETVNIETSENVEDVRKTTDVHKNSSRHLWLLFVTAFVACIIAFIGGYYLGRNSVEPLVKYKVVHVMDKSRAGAVRHDSVSLAKDTATVDSVSMKKRDRVDVDSKSINKAIETNADKTATVSNTLKNAKALVNTGAYRIVGTATTIKVKNGETLKKISRFYLGDGMECYIQVHNGIDDITPGMRLKIPKLEPRR